MDQSLQDLELRRKDLFRQMERLGDFRRGTISVNYRKCGRSNCACACKDHPGHGPQYLWNVSIGGKTQSRNLPLGRNRKKWRRRWNDTTRLSAYPKNCSRLTTGSVSCVRLEALRMKTSWSS